MMKNTIILSIIIPIYKVEQYVRECIDSVLTHEGDMFEVVLVDDGSPDNCGSICDEYMSKDNRVRVVHKKNGGLSDARNSGIQVAKGQYILLLDGDDMLNCKLEGQQWFSCLLSFLEQTKLPVYFFSCIEELPPKASWKQRKSPKVVRKNNFLNKFFFKVPYQAGWLYILNRDFLIQNSLFFTKGLLHEDEEWIPRIILSLYEEQYIGILPFPLYRYRLNRSGSITNTACIQRQEALLSIMETFASLYSKLMKQDQKFIATRIAHLYICLAMTKDLDVSVQKSMISLKKYLLKSKLPKHWFIYAMFLLRVR